MNKNKLYKDTDYKLLKLDNNTIKTIFGPPDGATKFVNKASLYSVTIYSHAIETCSIIKKLNPKAKKVMDATVCIGGNTGPMCDEFENVTATELDSNNYILAKANLINKNNLKLFNVSCLEYLMSNRNEKFDAIVIDPPWNLGDSQTINHGTIGIPGVSLKDLLTVLFEFSDYIVLKTSRLDDVRYYKEYVQDTGYDVLDLGVSNYKLMLFAPLGDPGLDFSDYSLSELKRFDYKSYYKK